MSYRNSENIVSPVDSAIGGDADPGGIAQEITVDDIQAILYSEQPLEERREALKGLKTDLQARDSADRGSDYQVLIGEVEQALAQLTS